MYVPDGTDASVAVNWLLVPAFKMPGAKDVEAMAGEEAVEDLE